MMQVSLWLGDFAWNVPESGIAGRKLEMSGRRLAPSDFSIRPADHSQLWPFATFRWYAAIASLFARSGLELNL
jgi:hypothetical protein